MATLHPLRLRGPGATRPTTILIWLVAAFAVGVAWVFGSRLGHTTEASPLPGPRPVRHDVGATVLRHPDPARPLEERWDWARAEAGRRGARGVWIGYYVRSSLLVDFRGLALPGPHLAELVGPGERSDDLAILVRITADRAKAGSRVPGTVVHVHVGGFQAPVDLGGELLVWLGAAEDEASLARLQQLYGDVPTTALREDLVVTVGLHGSSAAVVPLLERWSKGNEAANVRAEAARWLRHHGTSGETRPRPRDPSPRTPAGGAVRLTARFCDGLDDTKDFVVN